MAVEVVNFDVAQPFICDVALHDGFMATFGGVDPKPDAAELAVTCAFDLLDTFAEWNTKRASRSAEPVHVSIGLHFGDVIVGDVGTSERKEFTVIGDVVNVASRLERATREMSGSLLVSDACLAAAGGVPSGRSFSRALAVDIKGRYGSVYAHLV